MAPRDHQRFQSGKGAEGEEEEEEETLETFAVKVTPEQARHLLFVGNWTAWHRACLPWWRKLKCDARPAAVLARLICQRALIARDAGGNNFTATGHGALGITRSARDVLDRCVAEIDRRMSSGDARLLRPNLVPRPAQRCRRFV